MLDAGTNGLRTIVVRPGIVYGGSRGIVSDLLKDALNGLVRVIGAGKNRWPTVYDRDLGDLYVRLLQAPDARGIFHANDEADERVNDIVEAIADHLSQRPISGTCRCPKRGEAGHLRRRAGARSARPQSAREGAWLDADACRSVTRQRPAVCSRNIRGGRRCVAPSDTLLPATAL